MLHQSSIDNKSTSRFTLWFDNLLIVKKLALGFGVVVLLMAIMIGVNLYANHRSQLISEDIVNVRVPVIDAILQLESAVNESLAALSEYVILEKQDLVNQRQRAWTKIEDSLNETRRYSANLGAETTSNIETISRLLRELKLMQQRVESMAVIPSENENIKVLLIEITPITSRILAILTKIKNDQYEQKNDDLDNLLSSQIVLVLLTLALTVIVFVAAGACAWFITRRINKSIMTAKNTVDNIASGDLSVVIKATSSDEIGELVAKVANMQSVIKTIIEADIQAVVNSARQGDLSKRIVDSDKSGFYKDLCVSINELLEISASIINDAVSVFSGLSKGDLTVNISNNYQGDFNKIKNDANCTVKKLQDSINVDIRTVIAKANKGDLDARIRLDDKDGFFYDICQLVNQLIDVNQQVVNDTARIFSAMAQGDLSQTITGDYHGAFSALKNDANNTVSLLSAVIETEIQQVATAVVDGDLTRRIDLSDKKGFFKTLGASINQQAEVFNTVFSDTLRVVSAIEKGDLTQSVQQDYHGVYQQLKHSINSTVVRLTQVINDIQNSAESVKVASSEIAMGVHDLSERTEQQASSLEETAASMEQMTTSIQSSAKNSRTANEMTTVAEQCAIAGGVAVDSAIKAMRGISDASSKIAAIISVIDEIAFQTNLLALNAAVEAARAGEQGRGFAVVAGEVRTLAQRSAGAAKEIKDLINDSVSRVDSGTRLVNDSGETLKEIIESVKKVSTSINSLTISAEQQHAGIQQVSASVGHMDQMTQQNAALVEESSAASQAMAEQANKLTDLVSFFTTNNSVHDKHARSSTVIKTTEKVAPIRATETFINKKVSPLPEHNKEVPKKEALSPKKIDENSKKMSNTVEKKIVKPTVSIIEPDDEWEEF
jgi:methyl-accepting chemotaxis protein